MEFIFFLGLGAVLVFFAIRSASYNGGNKPVPQTPLERSKSTQTQSFAVRYHDPHTRQEVGIDIQRNLVVFASRDGSVTSYHFNDIVAVEALKDGQSLTVANRGSQMAGAAIGGLLLGPVGLLLGGLSGGSRSVEKVSKLSLRLVTNDIISPVVEIVFLNWPLGGGLTAEQPLLKDAARTMDEWYARFQTIVSRQMIEPKSTEEPIYRDVTPRSPYGFKAIE